MPYPSIADTDGLAVASLQGSVPIQAVPTTVVLDRQGRVAARVLGQADESTLKALIDGVIAVIGLALEKLVFQRLESYTVVRWGMMT